MKVRESVPVEIVRLGVYGGRRPAHPSQARKPARSRPGELSQGKWGAREEASQVWLRLGGKVKEVRSRPPFTDSTAFLRFTAAGRLSSRRTCRRAGGVSRKRVVGVGDDHEGGRTPGRAPSRDGRRCSRVQRQRCRSSEERPRRYRGLDCRRRGKKRRHSNTGHRRRAQLPMENGPGRRRSARRTAGSA